MVVIRMDRRVLIAFLAVVIILLALGLGVFIGSLSGGGSTTAAVQPPIQQAPVQQIPVQPQAPAAQQPQAPAQQPSNLPLITVDEARQQFGQPNALFVDSRVQTEWQRQRIKGAISMPHTEVAQRLSELPKDKDLIIYCA